METQFLAEDFRKILDRISEIMEADEADKTKVKDDAIKHGDIGDLIQTDRPSGISKEDVKDVKELIEYLDQYPELSSYRDLNAAYDDAYYADLPMAVLAQSAGISEEDLRQIESKTESFGGSIWVHDGEVTIFGGN
jgi:hypothetical protein